MLTSAERDDEILPRSAILAALIAGSIAPAEAADKEHQLLMAEIRMLQENQQQVRQVLDSLTETLKALNARLDTDAGRVQKSFADQKLLVEGVAETSRILREKADETNVRLATMTQEDLVYEVLKECFDPEIPLNVVDLGLICSVQVNRDSVDLKITMTSPQCPSHVSISEDIKTRLTDAGFPTPKIEIVWEPAWSPQRISEAGRKALGI